MQSSIPPLLGLQAYEAAARHLSFAAAATEMHLSASAISQRVRSLETHLGVRLFERLSRSLRLTEMGEAYLPAVRDIFEDLSASTQWTVRGLETGEPDGTRPDRLRGDLARTLWAASPRRRPRLTRTCPRPRIRRPVATVLPD